MGSGLMASYYGMMSYHLGWMDEHLRPYQAQTGKRLRPLLCLVACEAAGGDYRLALPAAAALELLHNYTLIHDDIEDHSEERRGRPTVWALWGQPLAINVGDGMHLLARNSLRDLSRVGVSLPTLFEASRVFDEIEKTLCEGQHLDMSFEHLSLVSSEAYYQMIGKKTASLLAASAQLGALVATGDLARAAQYRDYAYSLGLAFQIQDDVLGIWGSADVTGKAASDIYQKKQTLPLIYAAEQALPEDRAVLLALMQQPTLTDEQVAAIVAILDRIGARQFSQSCAERYYHQASQLVATANLEGPLAGCLQVIADFLIKRQH
jgi:geranylgeranyl diphosphate synthase type I